eukprot:CAMPEP_0183734682 /NCGR_PEP_ID=MMETSP0737-20130205/44500_1 /TAXON_ID=385413 /ORGANISM="Thalassiosira miniscula, Strain CCMP1093" /LENGTH=379 /DNA_ID=CAMNT_0025968241 /DNA_START=145 /DNA_END=1284 /DNA_ORIENTATION=+
MAMDSDDVSALSMDGASAIAGMGFARRLRKDFAAMQLGIPEDDEQAADQADTPPSDKCRRNKVIEGMAALHHHDKIKVNSEELIEPFPKTYEEWQDKKDKKKKRHKSKKHSKKSSKSGSSRSSKQTKEEQQQQQSEQDLGEHAKTPPIMEISIQSTSFSSDKSSVKISQQSRAENPSDSRSYHSSVASSAGSSSRNSHSRSSSIRQHNSHFTGSGDAMARALRRHNHHRSSYKSAQSVESQECTHMTGQSSAHSQSLLTVEDLQQLRSNLERARLEEKQVLDIHARLEREVRTVTEKAERVEREKDAVSLELDGATALFEELRLKFGALQEENAKLRSKLRALEDEETEQGLEDVMNSMEQKIRALKLKSKRSKKGSIK